MKHKNIKSLTAGLLLSALLFAGCTGNNADTTPPVTIPASTVTEVPVEVPTQAPAVAPTETPVAAPTQTPTIAPTATPTVAPTEVPATPTDVPTMIPTVTPLPTLPPDTDFYHVSGTNIVDGSGTPVLLKGIAMGNNIWSNAGVNNTDNNEESFKELSELGFNCVRFYLHYNFFEDDNAPYVYKESGFEWLNKRIAWAKKYNMRLILNMHAPQGGYQSQGNGDALWEEEENQKRLIALWTEIARRYAEEETIIGYGLINEPFVPVDTDIKEASAKCRTLMQRIADGIRTVNHTQILFVERVCGVENKITGNNMWNFSVQDALYTINDNNTVYEFHYYDPYNFTHQNMDWSNTLGVITYYPSREPVFGDAVSYWVGTLAATQKEELENGWTSFESAFAKKTSKANAGGIALRAHSTGAGGKVLFDDIVVEEYKDGEFVRTIRTLDFETETAGDDFSYWSQDGSGKYYYTKTDAYNGSRCLVIEGTTSDANVTGYRFELKEGYEYKIKGKVKCIGTNPTTSACPRIDYSQFGSIAYFDANYMASSLKEYLDFRKQNQVPLYMGEFGVCLPAWEENTGADQWVTDMLNFCLKENLHFNYHSYRDYHFGLYRSPIGTANNPRNEELADIFKKMLK